MKEQKELIHETDWDFLIILDACRYDYFEQDVDKFLEGDLQKVNSRSHTTQEWLNKTFPDYYDLIYFSANPFVNSTGEVKSTLPNPKAQFAYDGTKHFEEIVDLWNFAWDNEHRTVLPSVMTAHVQDYKDVDKPKILHFNQPHSPFISLVDEYPKGKGYWGIDALANKISPKQIRLGYRKNLLQTLPQIKYLASEYKDKKIIITADHGEILGEQGYWGHNWWTEKHEDLLAQVPWFEVESK